MSRLTEWLHHTFPTRERAVELLRPELEDNVLTPHDFELATRFLPGPSRYLPSLYSLGLVAAVFGFGHRVAQPRWGIWRLSLGCTAASLVGSAYGKFRIFVAHYQFTRALEDPPAFMTALNNVDKRLGGSGNMGSDLKPLVIQSKTKRNPDDVNHTQDAEPVPEEGWAQDHAHSEIDTSKSSPAAQRSKWEEIRAANSRSAGHSSWDTIRQRHERTRLPESNPSSDINETDDRATAQAKFDALLEAERRRGQF